MHRQDFLSCERKRFSAGISVWHGAGFPGESGGVDQSPPHGCVPRRAWPAACTGLGSPWHSFILNDSCLKVLRQYLRKTSFWTGSPGLGTREPPPPLARVALAGRGGRQQDQQGSRLPQAQAFYSRAGSVDTSHPDGAQEVGVGLRVGLPSVLLPRLA